VVWNRLAAEKTTHGTPEMMIFERERKVIEEKRKFVKQADVRNGCNLLFVHTLTSE